jgi:hypothetical protein
VKNENTTASIAENAILLAVVFVRTGEQRGPRRGRGQMIEVTQAEDGGWIVGHVGFWIS